MVKTKAIRPMLAAQNYREAGDLWKPLHEAVVQRHLDSDGFMHMEPKWDGFRGLLHESIMFSRSGKPLVNEALQLFARDHGERFRGMDGEVFSGHNYHAELFRETTSGIRTGAGSGNIMIVAYDTIAIPEASYSRRYQYLQDTYGLSDEPLFVSEGAYNVKLVLCPKIEVRSLEDIYTEEARLLALGFEGGITRRDNFQYKFGRSTALGGELTKVKRRESYDAIVEDYECRYENQNEAKTSELGFTTRSSHQENLKPLDMLGALHIRFVNGPYEGVKQKVGVFRGLSHGDLTSLWTERETLKGRYCEVSVDPATGGYDAARCPVWIKWRPASEF